MSDQPNGAEYNTPPFSDIELAAAIHAGQTAKNAPAFLATLDADARAAIVETHRLAELAADPIAQTATALLMMLSERADAIAGEMTDTSVADAQLTALRTIAGHDVAGSAIANAILQTERDRELTLKSARETASAMNRKRFDTVLTELARYGLPTVAPVTGSKSASKSAAPSTITDADHNVYVKNPIARTSYNLSGQSPCGLCPVSRDVIPQAPATAGDDAVKLPNFRQNSTKALAKMSRADVISHSACFAALTDAEYSYLHASNVHSYLLAE